MIKQRLLHKFRLLAKSLSVLAACLVLISLIIYVGEYGDSGQIALAPESVEPLRRADSYLLRPQGVKYRMDGSVAYQWSADTAERYSSGEIQMAQPVYIGLKEDASRWKAIAQRGLLSADGQLLTLEDDVVITDLLHAARIDTEQLLIEIESNKVSNDAALRLTTNTGYTNAFGLRADINAQHLDLLQEVRGRYEISP